MPKTHSLASPADIAIAPPAGQADTVALRILLAVSFCHLLNDSIQALIPAIYPLLKESFQLSYTQIGMITFAFQMVGSVLQPVVGLYTDKHPKPFSLVYGMAVTLGGLILLALAPSYPVVLAAAACVGLGSAIFHPESSRLARMASGGRHGFAQALFQVGGNAGTALGPLLAAGIIVPRGQRHILWFSVIAFAGMFILSKVGRWYQGHLIAASRRGAPTHVPSSGLSRRKIGLTLCVLLCLMFSKFIYLASMTSYYTFYLMQRFSVSVQESQVYLFIFLVAGAVGTFVGGPLGDRIGRKQVIWLSILGVAPFTLALPYVGLAGTAALSVFIGLIMASAFPAILVFATELLPGRVGLIAGLFFGLAFGLAGIGSALLGKLADARSIQFVMNACSYLPLIGLLTWFLPDLRKRGQS
ncbi:MAG: MFS transporter [Verrucomicrobia bacterium]|nr:MFS transporter [Verrucomicrobiota bacterium]MBI3869863.1 MFS transporter [Verrucomicrobiota bacterium]